MTADGWPRSDDPVETIVLCDEWKQITISVLHPQKCRSFPIKWLKYISFIESADGGQCKEIVVRKEKIIYFTSINLLQATHTGVLQQFFSSKVTLWTVSFFFHINCSVTSITWSHLHFASILKAYLLWIDSHLSERKNLCLEICNRSLVPGICCWRPFVAKEGRVRRNTVDLGSLLVDGSRESIPLKRN